MLKKQKTLWMETKLKWINKAIFLVVVFLALSINGYAEITKLLANKVADELVTKLNADKDIALIAIEHSKKIEINGTIFNHVTLGEDSILIGNGRVRIMGFDTLINENLTLSDMDKLFPIITGTRVLSSVKIEDDNSK